MTNADATSPAAIDVDRATAVTITWEDGHVSRYLLGALRMGCPCAGCRTARRQEQDLPLPDDLSIVNVELAGAWGMTPTWSDGHLTGIYSWTNLRAGCPCLECIRQDGDRNSAR